MQKIKAEPTSEQLSTLRDFAEKHGEYWKEELIVRWLDGSDASEPNGHLLRQLRNQFGPTWLSKFSI